jgi:hypothetical protein
MPGRAGSTFPIRNETGPPGRRYIAHQGQEDAMKRLLLIACAALPLAACTTYGPGYGPGPAVAYDGYYDDYYGPIYDGYWGDDGAFFYRTGAHGHYRRGDGAHFRHDMNGFSGGNMGHFHPMHGMGPSGMHGGGGHR